MNRHVAQNKGEINTNFRSENLKERYKIANESVDFKIILELILNTEYLRIGPKGMIL
jgi:hypothetical protein